eukprot:gene164-30858_t
MEGKGGDHLMAIHRWRHHGESGGGTGKGEWEQPRCSGASREPDQLSPVELAQMEQTVDPHGAGVRFGTFVHMVRD